MKIFLKKDENTNNLISDIIKNSYKLFVKNNKENNNNENDEVSENNFFSKMSLFIENQSIGKFSELKINSFIYKLFHQFYI